MKKCRIRNVMLDAEKIWIVAPNGGGEHNKCCPITINDFDPEQLAQCEIEQVCRKCSIFGNDLILITDNDIEALKNGKVLYKISEYGTFLAYKKEENDGTITTDGYT